MLPHDFFISPSVAKEVLILSAPSADFTETEAELRRLQMIGSQWKGLFDVVEEGIVVTDDRANVIRMNQTAAFMVCCNSRVVERSCGGGRRESAHVCVLKVRTLASL